MLRLRPMAKVPPLMLRALRPMLLGLVIAGLPSVAPRAEAAPGVTRLRRMAVVDVQRVLLETRQGKSAKQDLERTFAKSQARLDAKQKDLQRRLEDLRAKAPMLSEAKLNERQQRLMRSQSELQQLSMELQQEIMQKEALLTEKIYKNVAAIVKQIALEERLQAVLVRGDMTVLYANPKLDITNRVIVAYDKKYSG